MKVLVECINANSRFPLDKIAKVMNAGESALPARARVRECFIHRRRKIPVNGSLSRAQISTGRYLRAFLMAREFSRLLFFLYSRVYHSAVHSARDTYRYYSLPLHTNSIIQLSFTICNHPRDSHEKLKLYYFLLIILQFIVEQ